MGSLAGAPGESPRGESPGSVCRKPQQLSSSSLSSSILSNHSRAVYRPSGTATSCDPHVFAFLGAGYKITDACDCVPSCDAQNIVLSDSSTCSSKSARPTASDASTTKTTSRPLFAASPSPRHAGRAPHTLGNSSEYVIDAARSKTSVSARSRRCAPDASHARPTDPTRSADDDDDDGISLVSRREGSLSTTPRFEDRDGDGAEDESPPEEEDESPFFTSTDATSAAA